MSGFVNRYPSGELPAGLLGCSEFESDVALTDTYGYFSVGNYERVIVQAEQNYHQPVRYYQFLPFRKEQFFSRQCGLNNRQTLFIVE